MTELPNWTPELIKPILEQLNRHPRTSGPRREVMDRMLADPRMQFVYDELLRRDRKTGAFFHAPQSPAQNHSELEAQLAAISELLQLVVAAAGDRVAVTKIEQINAAKDRWLEDANRLRLLSNDIELASELQMLGIEDALSRAMAAEHVAVARRFANWLEHLTFAMRSADDPLVVDRHRGDPIVRGVQTMISVKLDEQFGSRFDGTAATLTAVALGAETTPRVSRSALAGKKAQ